MADEVRIKILSEKDIVLARERGRALAQELGFSSSDPTLIATAISEVARNILKFAGRGEIVLVSVPQNPKKGIVIMARDEGPGIPDIPLAMRDGYSTSNGLGLGLPGARRLMDDFEVESVVGKGTTITMKKWTR
ncbi:MAG TPA: anti-sigma regulatory factor [Bacteroidota bacterium]